MVAGLGAWAFRELIGLFHNILFLGEFSFDYVATQHTPPSPWGAWIIAIPPTVAILVAWMVKTFAPEAKGHGVPEVMEAIHYKDAKIRPQVVVVKALASSLSIGSGGSAGREGPIIQIGAAFGHLTQMLFPGMPMPVPAFAVAGMTAAVAVSTGALLTAIVMSYEMTRDYNAILPVVITSAVAWSTRRHLVGQSIYTIKLLRRGHVVPEGLPAGTADARRVCDAMSGHFVIEGAAGEPDTRAARIVVDGDAIAETLHRDAELMD